MRGWLTTYDEVKSDYHNQATKVNQAVTDYQKEYQAYLAKIKKVDIKKYDSIE